MLARVNAVSEISRTGDFLTIVFRIFASRQKALTSFASQKRYLW